MGIVKTMIVSLIGIGIITAVLVAMTTSPPGPAPGNGLASAQETSAAEVLMKEVKYAPATLTVATGTTVTWRNLDALGHTVTPTDAAAWGTTGSDPDPAKWLQQGDTWSFTFTSPGTYVYYCIPHASKGADGKYVGMVGTITVTGDAVAPTGPAFQMPSASIVPSGIAPSRKLPDADGVVRITLETTEVTAKLADGVAYTYWTFGGTVPGPMVRVREGDRVEVTLKNAADSTMPHSVDFHAVTGPGGGAKATQTQPGGSTSFAFRAIDPGVYVYHCATPHIPSHVANGMYGLIVVEPNEGWPKVDREFYVVESEWYTTGANGEGGLQGLDLGKLRSEDPDYFTFNGQVGALTGAGALQAKVGETVRIFFGVGGGVPSSFHIIGEVFDEVYMDGNLEVSKNRQTVLVPAAGSAIFDLKLEVPGDYILVDHTLTRAIDGGAVGILHVEGPEDPDIFQGGTTADSSH